MNVGLELMRRLYEVHNEDPTAFLDVLARECLHEDAELVELPMAPGARTHRGPDEIAALFRERFLAGSMQLEEFEVRPLDEHRVLASFQARLRGAESGAEASMAIWNLITLKNDRILLFEEFADEASALAAAAGRGASTPA